MIVFVIRVLIGLVAWMTIPAVALFVWWWEDYVSFFLFIIVGLSLTLWIWNRIWKRTWLEIFFDMSVWLVICWLLFEYAYRIVWIGWLMAVLFVVCGAFVIYCIVKKPSWRQWLSGFFSLMVLFFSVIFFVPLYEHRFDEQSLFDNVWILTLTGEYQYFSLISWSTVQELIPDGSSFMRSWNDLAVFSSWNFVVWLGNGVAVHFLSSFVRIAYSWWCDYLIKEGQAQLFFIGQNRCWFDFFSWDIHNLYDAVYRQLIDNYQPFWYKYEYFRDLWRWFFEWRAWLFSSFQDDYHALLLYEYYEKKFSWQTITQDSDMCVWRYYLIGLCRQGVSLNWQSPLNVIQTIMNSFRWIEDEE
jgi:hypothetical protein